MKMTQEQIEALARELYAAYCATYSSSVKGSPPPTWDALVASANKSQLHKAQVASWLRVAEIAGSRPRRQD